MSKHHKIKEINKTTIKATFDISMIDFMKSIQNNELELLNEFLSVLKTYGEKYKGFYFECFPDLSKFEFHIIKTSFPESYVQAYDIYFDKDSPDVKCITSYSGSKLIITKKNYRHIADFMLNSTTYEQIELWKEVGKQVLIEYESMNKKSNLYLSTHGKGINWLHIRIDDTPKYYSVKNFK